MGRMAHDNKMQITETRSRRGAEALPSEKKGANPEPAATPGRTLGPTL
jgi:hypothetical protein